MRQSDGERGEIDRSLAGDHGRERRPSAVVRHLHQIYLGKRLEVLRGEERAAAGPGRGVIEVAGTGPGEAQQFAHRPYGQGRMDGEHERRLREHRYGREIGDDVVVELAVDRMVDGVVGVGEKNRVAIRGRPCGQLASDIAAGAGAILYDDMLTYALREAVRVVPVVSTGHASGR